MAKSIDYVNGVIAAKEVSLLGGKIIKLCEISAEEAFRAVIESGFGKGAEASDVYGYENILYADEKDTDGFIREYSPSDAERAYFLSPRDFHNAKALLKARYLAADADKMLAPEGLFSAEEISRCIKEEDYLPLGRDLAEALKTASGLFNSGDGEVSGAEVGAVFENALYKHLFSVCAKNSTLKKLLVKKADMTNIITALRSASTEYAEKNYVYGGKLKKEQLEKLFSEDSEKAATSLDGTDYAEFARICLEDKFKGLPLTRAEIIRDDSEIDFLAERKYELKRTQPFLYYVLRRRAENSNLRILFVCLLAGMDENFIKKRMRAI